MFFLIALLLFSAPLFAEDDSYIERTNLPVGIRVQGSTSIEDFDSRSGAAKVGDEASGEAPAEPEKAQAETGENASAAESKPSLVRVDSTTIGTKRSTSLVQTPEKKGFVYTPSTKTETRTKPNFSDMAKKKKTPATQEVKSK